MKSTKQQLHTEDIETYQISTSGLLCLSTFCDGKFLKHAAADAVFFTQSR